jgi:hypothetical protein
LRQEDEEQAFWEMNFLFSGISLRSFKARQAGRATSLPVS